VWNTATGMVGAVLARTMTRGGDNLNHQGAIAIVLDASTLEVVRNHGQTSGHSFGNSMILSRAGEFLSMDLGDNYPRGINLVSFTEQARSKSSFVVYNFKTHHGQKATSPAGATYPEYTEISTAETTYYKWSNDNYVYTELGHAGVVEVDDGFLVFFSGERPPLDSSRVGAVLNEARNVGFVKVGKDLSLREVLSPGGTQTGGYYSFGGRWLDQENRGINFLTNLNGIEESASRLKTARLAGGAILLYWEVWTRTAYRYAQMAVVTEDGILREGPWKLDYPMRLAIQDDLRVRGGRAIAYAGATDGHIVRYELCGGDTCPSAGDTTMRSTTMASTTMDSTTMASTVAPTTTTMPSTTASPTTTMASTTASPITTMPPTTTAAATTTMEATTTEAATTTMEATTTETETTRMPTTTTPSTTMAATTAAPTTSEAPTTTMEATTTELATTTAACVDSTRTGFSINRAPASCAQLAPYCDHARYGARIQRSCPATCGADCCKDHEETGFTIGGQPASCTQLAPYCGHSIYGERIRRTCPQACDVCV